MTATQWTLRPEKMVMPGEVWFGQGAQRVGTLLGSCVAITLWHPKAKAGGLCHYMLPERGPAARGQERRVLDGRYGDEALALLLAAARRAGCMPTECEVKLFGGGRMFASTAGGGETLQVHLRNVEQAHRLVRHHGLRVVAQHLGGQGYRQLRLDLSSGDVWVRFSPCAGFDEGVATTGVQA